MATTTEPIEKKKALSPVATNIEGKCTSFNRRKGFGFVSCKNPLAVDEIDEKHLTCFVHYSDITDEGYRSLTKGDKIQFDLVPNPREEGYYSCKSVIVLEAVPRMKKTDQQQRFEIAPK